MSSEYGNKMIICVMCSEYNSQETGNIRLVEIHESQYTEQPSLL